MHVRFKFSKVARFTCGISMHGTTHYVMNKSIAKRCSPKCKFCGDSILVGEKVVSTVSRYNHSRTWYHRGCHNNMYFPFRGKQGIVVVKQRDR